MSEKSTPGTWDPQRSAELYRVAAWGQGYFGVNDRGHVVVRPTRSPAREIDLFDVVEGLRSRDLAAPIVIRFSDILADRLRALRNAFSAAIEDNAYRGRYAAVYPIKVNQHRLVVEEVFRFGEEFGFGLEVGSKPELLAVLALTEDCDNRLIICNGFKDDSYIETVILATKLGRMIIPVVENFAELGLILKHAERYGVRPRLGVRVKLDSPGAGRWSGSSGAKSKFGLFVSEIVELFDVLTARQMQDCLQLVHCHPGSQLQDIHLIKEAINELAQIYAGLVEMGVGLRYIDVGGGLGVDYDGSRSNSPSSMNYALEEYANDVVYRIGSVCDARGIQHPTIISESGRAVAAYSSVLVFNVLDALAFDELRVGEITAAGGGDAPQPMTNLINAHRGLDETTLVERYHDAVQARQEALQLFNLGYLTLHQRSTAEKLYWSICLQIRDHCRILEVVPEELAGLDTILSDTYICNFSIFQSLPDSWAISQLFPIMPIHRLADFPDRDGILADITCDSDGKIDRFVDRIGEKHSLPLHGLTPDSNYYLAAFLVGAYQETLGDLHNLFGDTHVVHIRMHEDGGWRIDESVRGDTARELLGYMQFDVDKLYPRLSRDFERAVYDGRMTLEESLVLRRFYDSQLGGYTYLAPDGRSD